MTFDPARGVTVLVGGFAADNRTNVETWEWNGTTWRQAKTKTKPTSMTFPALTYNPFHRVAVLVGEVGGAGTPIRTFAYDGTDWHVGPSAPRTLFGHQAPGVAFDEARDAAVLFGGAPIGLPGCPLLVSIEHAQAMTAIGKTAGIVFPIPLDPSQLGVTVFAQALVLGREHATSNGAKLVVGN